MLTGHQHHAAEPLALQAIEGAEVDDVGEPERTIRLMEVHGQHIAQVLPAEPRRDLGLERRMRAALASARQPRSPLGHSRDRFRAMLRDAAALQTRR